MKEKEFDKKDGRRGEVREKLEKNYIIGKRGREERKGWEQKKGYGEREGMLELEISEGKRNKRRGMGEKQRRSCREKKNRDVKN